MDKLTNLEQLRAVSLAAKELIGEVAEATAEALEEMAAQQQGGIPAGGGGNIPSGGIIIWSGAADAVPESWALCDGGNGTPDLRGRFVLGSADGYAAGSTGGEETHTLTKDEMPEHNHFTFVKGSNSYVQARECINATKSKSASLDVYYTGYEGDSKPHNNMPPYYVLCYIMKL